MVQRITACGDMSERHARLVVLGVVVPLLLSACSSSSGGHGSGGSAIGNGGANGGSPTVAGSAGKGGVSGTGGVQSGGAAAGGVATGGAGAGLGGTGAMQATGGVASSGGAPGQGGFPSSGGKSGMGGASASGGVVASGGIPNAGGTSGKGGTTGSGGTVATSASGGTVGSGGISTSAGTSGKGGAAGSGGTVSTGGTSAAGPVQMVDAAHVRLLSGSPFYDRQELHRKGALAQLDTDKLLYEYRNFAKVPQANGVTAGYGGWDSGSGFLRGHMLGHYLSAASRMAAATGDTSFTTKVNYVVGELAKCQAALGNGYLAAFPTAVFDWVEGKSGASNGGIVVPTTLSTKSWPGCSTPTTTLETSRRWTS
jgi:hypothetical protein